MIGLLIISHSASVAQGVKELAGQMTKGLVPIAAAGGTHDGQLGTSADLILVALEELKGASAVLTLVDMGSAIMSAEMALEMSGVVFMISGAPLVEGALVAAIEAMRPEATLEQVAAVAARALETKNVGMPTALSHADKSETKSESDEMPLSTDPTPPGSAVETTLTVLNRVGLHMRPAKDFVQEAARFAATVRVHNLDRPERSEGNAKSIVDIMKLGVAFGHRILVRAEGDDALAAVEALSKLVADKFGEA